jgi:large subunit ribosomal protein L1
MAKTKAELLDEAKKLGLDVNEKNTVVQINEAIAGASSDEKPAEKDEENFAKSGKRSAKHQDEVAEKQAKDERKAAGDTTPQGDAEAHIKRGPKPITRSRLARRGKNYRAVAEKVDFAKVYPLSDALKLATETCPAKFDSTVEIHVRLGVDPRQADQNIRATVTLPNGTGKTVRVVAFVPEADAAAAKTAGADIAGEEAIIKMLDKENIDFDVLVATPQLMPKLGKYARLLGPRGLMPNPKSGTVSTNPAQAVKEAKGGKVEYRVDKQAIVHLGIGKVSFGASKLEQNARVFLTSLNSVKPTTMKGTYVLSIAVSTTMGPGIKVESTNI